MRFFRFLLLLMLSNLTHAQSEYTRPVYHFECRILQELSIPFVLENELAHASDSEKLDDSSDGWNGLIYRSGRFFVNRDTGAIKSDFSFRREGQAGIETTEVMFGPTGEEGETVLVSSGGAEAPFEAVYWLESGQTKATLLRIQTYFQGTYKPFIAFGLLGDVYYGLCVNL